MSNLILGVLISGVPISHKNAYFVILCYKQVECFESHGIISSRGED